MSATSCSSTDTNCGRGRGGGESAEDVEVLTFDVDLHVVRASELSEKGVESDCANGDLLERRTVAGFPDDFFSELE